MSRKLTRESLKNLIREVFDEYEAERASGLTVRTNAFHTNPEDSDSVTVTISDGESSITASISDWNAAVREAEDEIDRAKYES